MPAVVFGPDRVIGRGRPRTGLVLGAGGVLGAAWMTGALVRLQERLPLADVDLLVGTSAGSVLAAALRCRASLDEIVAWQRGDATGMLSESMVLAAQDGPLPPWPQLRPGSLPLARAALLLQVPPWVGASGWLPHGRGRHEALRSLVGALQKRHRPGDGSSDAGSWARAAGAGPTAAPGSWPWTTTAGTACCSATRVPRGRRWPTPWSPPARSRAGTSRPASAAAGTWTAVSARPPRSASWPARTWRRSTCSRRWLAPSPIIRSSRTCGSSAGSGRCSPARCSARRGRSARRASASRS